MTIETSRIQEINRKIDLNTKKKYQTYLFVLVYQFSCKLFCFKVKKIGGDAGFLLELNSFTGQI